MEKILVTMDATKLNRNLLDFAAYVARLTHSKITGVFLESPEAEEIVPVRKSVLGMPYVDSIVAGNLPEVKERNKLYNENVKLFKEACDTRGIPYSLCYNHCLADIITESRFADVLIVDAEMSFNSQYDGTPSSFIKEVLAKAECPVIIAPFHFTAIEEILFAYDGSMSCVFAMKQFTYLFPELADKKIRVLEVNAHKDSEITQRNKVGEWLKMHYSCIGFELLHGNASTSLLQQLLGKQNTFVVMGAFGRNMLSGFFKHSTAELVIRTIDLPVFIAHH
ncbi:hypothetical protein SAMN05421788_102505 [Filimonas lacunae]|uniref:Nucleotide-binding universal stress protein, UspA family n=1 Tax=Filimonas lacunae TaxID=477680 RepID=A0A173MHF6_9BACT|nr:universal stress protein [Filimonas lacunae]BAV06861.1 hypothetical protein FLA_2881 [Filimonas lacunae]SIS98710.1 hypothetical protein SAMN05421788_102505 [Filimonas lacunae]